MSLISIPVFIACCTFSCTGSNNDNIDPLYVTIPEIAQCKKGEVSEQEKEKVVKHVNDIRKIYNLPKVEYSSSKDAAAQSVALIIAAKGELSPVTEGDNCYSDAGYEGWLAGDVSFWGSTDSKWPPSEYHIDDCIAEKGSETVFRRRDILDPFLKSISFGRVIGSPKRGSYKYVSAAALVVRGNAEADLSETEISGFIAFPQGVIPAKYFDPDMLLSFSVFRDKAVKMNNRNVDFSNAAVEVFSGMQALAVTDTGYDSRDYGLPNSLQWKVNGLAKNVTYSVKILNVDVAGEIMEYEYTFSFR